jgi:hypothetical protein
MTLQTIPTEYGVASPDCFSREKGTYTHRKNGSNVHTFAFDYNQTGVSRIVAKPMMSESRGGGSVSGGANSGAVMF